MKRSVSIALLLVACGGGSGGEASPDGGGGSGGSTPECTRVCRAKFSECGLEPSACDSACLLLAADQVQCIDAASCGSVQVCLIDGTGGAGGADGGSGAGGVGGTVCALETYEPEIAPLAAYLLLDTSGSMQTDYKMETAVDGLSAFFAAPESAGMFVGLNYFPGALDTTAMCQPSAYETLAVDFAALDAEPAPGDAQEAKLVSSLAQVNPTGGTPMYPALLGALTRAKTYAAGLPELHTIVLLITDGEPSGCNTTTNQASVIANTAAQFASATPAVRTYTIGLPGSNQSTLQAIAQAGGGAFYDLGNSFTPQGLVAAINQIRAQQIPCSLPLPKPSNGALNPSKVSVTFINGSGVRAELVQVESAAQCVLNGWYYELDSQTWAPTAIALCSSVCDAVQQDPSGKLEVAVLCD